MRSDQRAFPVVEGERMVGLVCLEDIRAVPQSEWPPTRVSAIMTPAGELTTLDPDEDATEALQKLASKDVDQLPVVRDGSLLGFLRRQDLIRWLAVMSPASAH
jgi:CBS domain-containing protein